EWLISFADNAVLMMGFFVILLAMNMGPKGSSVNNTGEPGESTDQAAREADFVIGIRDAFNNKIDPNGDKPEEAVYRKRIKERAGGPATEEGPQGNAPALQAIRPSDYNRVTCSVPFDEGDATLSASGHELVAQAARKMRDQKWIIEVRGHVSPFESMRNVKKAMQLSHDRSMSVAFALVEGGVKWENIRIVACGDSDRLVPRTFDREMDRSNRRVEVVETNDSVGGEPSPKDSTSDAEPHGEAAADEGAGADEGPH
ncbi:MAG: OmpA/MotB family protein, partial [Phycisphaerales bacterium]